MKAYKLISLLVVLVTVNNDDVSARNFTIFSKDRYGSFSIFPFKIHRVATHYMSGKIFELFYHHTTQLKSVLGFQQALQCDFLKCDPETEACKIVSFVNKKWYMTYVCAVQTKITCLDKNDKVLNMASDSRLYYMLYIIYSNRRKCYRTYGDIQGNYTVVDSITGANCLDSWNVVWPFDSTFRLIYKETREIAIKNPY